MCLIVWLFKLVPLVRWLLTNVCGCMCVCVCVFVCRVVVFDCSVCLCVCVFAFLLVLVPMCGCVFESVLVVVLVRLRIHSPVFSAGLLACWTFSVIECSCVCPLFVSSAFVFCLPS